MAQAMNKIEQDDRPLDNGLRQFMGYTLKRAYLTLRADMILSIEPLGLRTRTFSALSVVAENPDITQTQLACALNIERSGVVVLVDELQRAGLITRNKVPGDRRSYALRATTKGMATWKDAEARVLAHERQMLAGLTTEEQENLKVLLRRIGAGA
ncbi:MAG: MarR family transcriptional regulator [Pseudomonadota bacterium]|jgi:DNA-binding MarR family transcriptional regulator|nr:MarR family transcriptional regulator [Pseudomonadota bacterium]